MRVLRQSKVPRAEVIFFIIQRKNIRLSKKQVSYNAPKLPDVFS
jgi:hypothetical protein